MESRFTTGDRVVLLSTDFGFLKKYIGQFGVVTSPLEDCDVGVTFADGDTWWFVDSDLALPSEYDAHLLQPGDLSGLFKGVANV